MSKLTIDQKLRSKKIGRPNILYPIIGSAWNLFIGRKYNIHCTYECDIKKAKGPLILISNHASRLDYMFTAMPLLPQKYNFVAGYNEFFRSHLKGILGLLRVIPKKNFTSDIYTIKQISNVLKHNGRIMIMPEGMSSISGHNQPIALGTGKMIKFFGVPIYYTLIQGGYLTSTKYCLDDRIGRVDVTYRQLFTKEDIEKLSASEIEDKINSAIYQDDYKWNLEKQYKYDTHGEVCKNLEDLLYYCPKCGKEYTMHGEGNKFVCSHCGNGVTIDDTYKMTPLDDTCVIPNTQTDWFDLERENIKREIQNENFELKEEVELGMLPDYEYLKDQKTSNIVGNGIITLNHQGLHYRGTKNNEEFNFDIELNLIPTYGMCTDVSRFYTFLNGTFVEFYPKHRTVEKWFLATEELHRMHGGKWKDFDYEKGTSK